MKKTILTFGLIGGIVISSWTVATLALFDPENFENGMYYGYAGMIIAFSMTFVGIKNYRDKYNEGIIGFGKALKIGLLITLIASTLYVITWEITYFFFMPDFMEKYVVIMLEKMKAGGATAAEIQAKSAEMESMKIMYKNPFFNIVITYAEILWVGVVISLISAGILKRKIVHPVVST